MHRKKRFYHLYKQAKYLAVLVSLEKALEDADLIKRMKKIVTLIDLEIAKFPHTKHLSYL